MNIKLKVLFVDDDAQYQRVIKNLLELEGYEIEIASNAADAIELFQKNHYDLVLSDVMMESIDGLQLLSFIRRIDSKIKVILLTASVEEAPEIKGLNLLANDFIRKPVSFDVLLARINRVFSQTSIKNQSILSSDVEEIEIDKVARRVTKKQVRIELTIREYDTLIFFLENKNRVLTREEILEGVWKITSDSRIIDERSVDSVVKSLRKQLNLVSIYSIRGIGYEWVE